ncbi:MAG: glycosyltransferase family 4 protein [Omnitrophica WOR_2 bacterium]
MRIGIDARFLTHPQTGGFKTYTVNLISALAEVDSENEYILYLDRIPNSETLLPSEPNFSYRVIEGQVPMVGMFWREQVRLSQAAIRDHIELLHSPCLTAPVYLPCPSVVTIHDTIWRSPEIYAKRKRLPAHRRLMELYYRYIPELAVKRASVVITVSQAAKKSIIEQLGLPSGQIQVTYEAASRIFHPVTGFEQIVSIRRKYGLSKNFILAIGSADPRKNIATLIQAYGLLPARLRDRNELAIVWNHPTLVSDMVEQVETMGLADKVHFLNQVSSEDLAVLYNTASLFVFPSLYEGFGLPLLEAMSCGAPVIAADNSSIPEVAGDAALLVKAEDTESLARFIREILQDEALRRKLSEKGLQRAKCFSWKKCGCETVSAYQKAVIPGPDRIFSVQKNCA